MIWECNCSAWKIGLGDILFSGIFLLLAYTYLEGQLPIAYTQGKIDPRLGNEMRDLHSTRSTTLPA